MVVSIGIGDIEQIETADRESVHKFEGLFILSHPKYSAGVTAIPG